MNIQNQNCMLRYRHETSYLGWAWFLDSTRRLEGIDLRLALEVVALVLLQAFLQGLNVARRHYLLRLALLGLRRLVVHCFRSVQKLEQLVEWRGFVIWRPPPPNAAF